MKGYFINSRLNALLNCFLNSDNKEDDRQKSDTLKNWSGNITYVEIPDCGMSASFLVEPDGVFTCENVECKFETKRYTKTNIPDSMACPLCGSTMVNKGLSEKRSNFHEAMKIAGAGNPEGFAFAIDSCDLFFRIFDAEKINNWKYLIPELDYIYDVISKVKVESVQNNLFNKLPHVSLDQYPYSLYENMLRLQSISVDFINSNITSTPTKQVNLVPLLKNNIDPLIKELDIINPSFSDATWYFYVWRQFGLVKCYKEGKCNMIYK